MKGRVDDGLRALLVIQAASSPVGSHQPVTVWVDTAFNGFLVFPRQLIKDLGLRQEAATEAVPADGKVVVLESYAVSIQWFGSSVRAQVIANDGKLPLLGTELLAGRRLTIDYADKTLLIE